ADSDLAALSSITMADIYGQNVAGKERANPKTMLLLGRLTMIVATATAVVFASLQLNILDLLVFVGALWCASVFPVLASFCWRMVPSAVLTVAVRSALPLFSPVRFGLIPMDNLFAYVVDILAILGVGVVLG